MRQIVIIGIGLMGGSLAAALKEKSAGEIVGIDKNAQAIDAALNRGIIDKGHTVFHEAVPAADIIILATPVQDIIKLIPEVGKIAKQGAIITDLGSTKEKILECMDALPNHLQAVGGHPICGRFESGVEYADPALYQGRTFVLTPGLRTTAATLEVMEELIQRIGGVPERLYAKEHDQLLAITSHLPRILPLALLSLLQKKDSDAIWSLAGGNLKNSTYLATNNIPMWLDIILTNRKNLAKTLNDLSQELEMLARQIEAGNQNAIHERLLNASADWDSHFGIQS